MGPSCCLVVERPQIAEERPADPVINCPCRSAPPRQPVSVLGSQRVSASRPTARRATDDGEDGASAPPSEQPRAAEPSLSAFGGSAQPHMPRDVSAPSRQIPVPRTAPPRSAEALAAHRRKVREAAAEAIVTPDDTPRVSAFGAAVTPHQVKDLPPRASRAPVQRPEGQTGSRSAKAITGSVLPPPGTRSSAQAAGVGEGAPEREAPASAKALSANERAAVAEWMAARRAKQAAGVQRCGTVWRACSTGSSVRMFNACEEGADPPTRRHHDRRAVGVQSVCSGNEG